MDFGYHVQLSVAMKQHVSAEENCIKSKQACLELMNKCVTDLDQRTDKQRFLEIYNQTFSLPKKFDFQPDFLIFRRAETLGLPDEELLRLIQFLHHGQDGGNTNRFSCFIININQEFHNSFCDILFRFLFPGGNRHRPGTGRGKATEGSYERLPFPLRRRGGEGDRVCLLRPDSRDAGEL